MRVALYSFLTALMVWCSASPVQAQSLPQRIYEQFLVMPGPVVQGHAELEKKCTNCHTPPGFKDTPNRLCRDCHKDVDNDMIGGRGMHGLRKDIRNATCKSCHTDHKGRTADIVGLDRELFNHNPTNFKLTGGHAAVTCKSCHAPGEKFRKAESECSSCHTKIVPASFAAKDAGNPRKRRFGKTSDPHRGRLPDCAACHNDTSWKDLKPFDHAKATAKSPRGSFVLVAQHAKATCATCHAGEQYKNLPRTCASCHVLQDNHKGTFGKRCDICHSQTDWKITIIAGNLDGSLSSAIRVLTKASFNHDKTDFPLVGFHKTKPTCESCHKKTFKGTSKNCYACHKKDDAHEGRFGTTCETCHRPLGFKNLLGTASSKGSLAAAIRALEKVSFDHGKTKFPLIGFHKTKPKCADCHKTSFRKTPQNCSACHAKDDAHKGRFGTTCEACHSPNGWKTFGGVIGTASLGDAIRLLRRAKFDHSKTRFPLTGRHRRAKCEKCHKKSFKDTPRDCFSCHERKGRREHGRKAATRFRNCARCHSTRGW